MTRSLFAFGLVMALAGGTWAQKAAPSRSNAADEVKKAEEARCQAVAKNDSAFLEKQTTDDYTLVTFTGQMQNKSDMVQGFKSGQTKFTSYQCSDITARVYGNTAVTTGISMGNGTVNGQSTAGRRIRFLRVWVKEKGEWKSAALQQTEIAKP